MKNLVFTLFALISFTLPAFGQGEVFFANRIPGSIDARALILCGDQGFADSSFNADLAVLRNGVWESVPGSVTPFRGTPGSAANGYITGFNITIPGIAPGEQATLKMRGFQGTSWETRTIMGGETDQFLVTLGGGTIPVPNMDGLGPNPWPIFCVPEPSTVAFGLLGAGLLLRNRRRS